MNRRTPSGVTAELPLQRSERGGSGSFLVRASDGKRYWCKVVNNPQHPRVPVNEEIVARVGLLIGVALCEPQLVRVPSDLAGWEFHAGHFLEEGWAHGSAAVEVPVVETRSLQHRGEDDNARRHAGFLALHDWLCGQDAQWLVAQPAQNMYWSHDHGHYLPDGPGWTVDSLRLARDSNCALATDTGGLDQGELGRLADALESVTGADLLEALAETPPDWPVGDDELEAVVDFLVRRARPVAARVRSVRTGGTA